MLTVVGSYLSPYVRKVLAVLELKQIPYEIDPIVPFYGNDAFTAVSPVRRIPVLLDDAVTVPESDVICQYLDERYPERPLYPDTPQARAQARWLESYAGSRIGEVFIWRYFNQLVIRRFVWGEPPDEEMVQRSRAVDIPQILAYLESVVPERGFLFGEVAVADLAIATFFRNVEFTRAPIDFDAAPRTQAFVERTLALPAFEKLRPFEAVSLRTPIAQHREALAAAGAPISAQSFFTDEPRRGVLHTA